MPFEEKNGRVEIIRPYGEDADGNFNHGVDFKILLSGKTLT